MDQHQAAVWQALIDRLEPENIRMREAIRQARELVQKIDDDELRISIMKALDW